MGRTELPRWSLALALLLAPAALRAQAPTTHPNPDTAAATPAKKAHGAAAAVGVVCRDGTAGADRGACASHGGVDAVTTNVGRTGRVDRHPVETGQTENTMDLPGRAGMARDTARIKPDSGQSDGWGTGGWTTPRGGTDTTSAASDSTN